MIKKVIFENFKNKKGTQELTGFDMFVGANGVGKSAVVEAIELSLLGKIKDRKTPKEMFKLSRSTNSMEVGIEIAHGGEDEEIRRIFQRKEKADGTVTYSQKLNASFTEVNTIKEQEEEMAEALGTLPISFDFNSFVALTNREKKDFILSFSSKRPMLSPADFEELILDRLVKTAPSVIDAKILEESVKAMIAEVLGFSSSTVMVLESLELMMNEAKDKVSYFRRDADRCLKSLQKLTEKRSSMGIVSTKIALDEKVLEKKRESLIKLSSKLTEKKDKQMRLSKEEGEMESLTKTIEAVLNEEGPNAGLLKQAIENEKSSLISLNTRYEAIQKESEDILNQIDQVKEVVKTKRDEFANLRETGLRMKDKIADEEALITQVESTKGRCVINSSIPCHENFGEWVSDKKSNIVIMTNKLSKVREEFTAIHAELKKNEDLYESLHKMQRNLSKEQNNLVVEINAVNKKLSDLNHHVEKAFTFDKVKEEKLANLNENKRLKEELIKVLTEELVLLDAQNINEEAVNELKQDIQTSQDTISKKKEVLMLTTQIEESQKEEEIATKSLAVYKYLQAELLSLKTSVFADLIEPVANAINRNLTDMGYDKFFGEMDGLDFNFGLVRSGEKIMFETLSTGQQAVLSCAMVAALIENSDTKLKVFALDNIESIDYDNLEKVINGLDKMSKRFDNIILSGCLTDIPLAGNLKLWKL